jgi:predicted regulator of Ras-like GTPase activity (Roadblock/LC7/MglB family)
MFDRILLLDEHTPLGAMLTKSLAAEGYEVTSVAKADAARRRMEALAPHLVVINAVGQPEPWLEAAAAVEWTVPVILLTAEDEEPIAERQDWQRLSAPFAFQDMLFLVQNALQQRTLSGRRPFELPPGLIAEVKRILKDLREDVRARCVVLSSSSGRLIKTVGAVDRSVAISLAALMSGSFSASAKAAQLLGQNDMFDSNLQESEGYGLYAILLRDKLILTVAFSTQVTIGMVRHYAAQAALDILEVLMHETAADDATAALKVDADFRQDVVEALGNLLGG